MIHAAIYDNRQKDDGFGIYETTPGFPEAYKRDIIQVCDRMQLDDHGRWALRYTPLKDMFLLTVCFRRLEGSEHQNRAHCQDVNFLLDRKQASMLFATPLRVTDLVAMAEECFTNRLSDVLGAWQRYFENKAYRNIIQEANELPVEAWEPLLYSCVTHGKGSQLFVETDDAELYLYTVHQYLPHRLRMELPFLINSVSLRECMDVELIFCPTGYLDKMQNSLDGQGLFTDKIYLRWNSLGWWDGTERRKEPQVRLLRNLRTLNEAYSPGVTDILMSSIRTWDDLERVCKNPHHSDTLYTAIDFLAERNPEGLRAMLKKKDEGNPAVAEIVAALQKAQSSDGKKLRKELKKEQRRNAKIRKKLMQKEAHAKRGSSFRRLVLAFSSPRLFAFLLTLLASVPLIFNHFRIVDSAPNSARIIITTSGYYSMIELLIAFLAGGAMFYALFGSSRSGKKTSERKSEANED